MNKSKIIFITMILNLIVAIMKLVAGILFSFSSLIADSVQSFIDFATDITSFIANKIGKRRANKLFPFGYGQIYYLSNLLTGILLFIIGIFILYQFFFFEGEFFPTPQIFIILVVILILKGIVVYLLNHYGKYLKSELMIESSKESAADFVSTCVVLIISILVLFEKYLPSFINIDKIGSLGIAIYVFYVSIKIMIANTKGVLLNTDENEKITDDIRKELSKFQDIKLESIKLVRMSKYYSLFLKVKADDNMTIKEYITIERQIKKHLKAKDKEIRFVDIEPV